MGCPRLLTGLRQFAAMHDFGVCSIQRSGAMTSRSGPCTLRVVGTTWNPGWLILAATK